MKKYSFLVFLVSIYMAKNCEAQNPNQGVFSSSIKKEIKKPVKKTSNTKPPDIKYNFKATVTITTDEECTLKIGAKEYGTIKAGETKYLTLTNGTYELTAINKTQDEYLADLDIKGKTSTVRINLAQIRIKRLQKEDSVKNSTIAIKGNSDTVKGKQPGGISPVSSSDEELKVKATVTELLSNMVSITAGNFIMGNNIGTNDEGPEHSVTIRAVQIGKYEVTQQQWETVMGINPSINQGCKDCPVENVSWNEIDYFLHKINRIGSQSFRLPTEAEYEYIATKGNDRKDLKQKAWYKANSEMKTHPVGTKLPNSFGIYDLSGNVAEWCSDWYRLNYYKKRSVNNPVGPSSGKDKVVRGGSYDDAEAPYVLRTETSRILAVKRQQQVCV